MYGAICGLSVAERTRVGPLPLSRLPQDYRLYILYQHHRASRWRFGDQGHPQTVRQGGRQWQDHHFLLLRGLRLNALARERYLRWRQDP